MTIETRAETVISVANWDKAVRQAYNRPYSFQQQDGCQPRGFRRITVPAEGCDFTNDSVKEEINGDEMGVSFSAWQTRDPSKPVADEEGEWTIELWWHRNFYPELQTVANDLHERGILPAGDYTIEIDW